MRTSRSISISLIISFIAVFMYGDLFTNEADADCDDFTSVSQIAFGYLAGGATLLVSCAGVLVVAGNDEDAGLAWIVPTAYIFASAGTVYGIGQRAGCSGSFMWTLGGAVASPIAGGIIGILGGIGKNNESVGTGVYCGFVLIPISATIAYHLTKEKSNPGKDEIIVPLMSMRF